MLNRNKKDAAEVKKKKPKKPSPSSQTASTSSPKPQKDKRVPVAVLNPQQFAYGCPVLFQPSPVFQDKKTGKYYLELEMTNVAPLPITYLYLRLSFIDGAGNLIGDAQTYITVLEIRDKMWEPGEKRDEDTRITLPDNARNYIVQGLQVNYVNGAMERYMPQQFEYLKPVSALGKNAPFFLLDMAQREKDVICWPEDLNQSVSRCVCGGLIPEGKRCPHCGREKISAEYIVSPTGVIEKQTEYAHEERTISDKLQDKLNSVADRLEEMEDSNSVPWHKIAAGGFFIAAAGQAITVVRSTISMINLIMDASKLTGTASFFQAISVSLILLILCNLLEGAVYAIFGIILMKNRKDILVPTAGAINVIVTALTALITIQDFGLYEHTLGQILYRGTLIATTVLLMILILGNIDNRFVDHRIISNRLWFLPAVTYVLSSLIGCFVYGISALGTLYTIIMVFSYGTMGYWLVTQCGYDDDVDPGIPAWLENILDQVPILLGMKDDPRKGY